MKKTTSSKYHLFFIFRRKYIYFILSLISPLHVEDFALNIGSTIPSIAISILVFLVIELLIKKVKLKNKEYSIDKKIE